MLKGWPQVRILPLDKDMRKLDWGVSSNPGKTGINVSDLDNPNEVWYVEGRQEAWPAPVIRHAGIRERLRTP
jgi:hypothetical protein